MSLGSPALPSVSFRLIGFDTRGTPRLPSVHVSLPATSSEEDRDDGIDRSADISQADQYRGRRPHGRAARHHHPRPRSRRRSSRRGGRAVGHRDTVRVAHRTVREASLGLSLRSADPARFEDVGVPPWARDRMEAVERSQGVDVQVEIRREVPRELGRADGRGRQVHGRAEPEARRPGRVGAVFPAVPRPHRDARRSTPS